MTIHNNCIKNYTKKQKVCKKLLTETAILSEFAERLIISILIQA